MWATKGSDRRKAKRYLRRMNDALNDPHEDVAKHWEAALTQAPPRDTLFSGDHTRASGITRRALTSLRNRVTVPNSLSLIL
jgi:hypothetical protein